MKGKGRNYITLWSLLFMVTIPLSVFGTDGQIEIGQTPTTTFPVIIDQPGDYVLTSDFIVSIPDIHCFRIDADDVCLDLNAHNLNGPGQGEGMDGAGIYSSGRNNIAVLNGTVQGFMCGIDLGGANNEVKSISANNNIYGGIKTASSTITNCTANDNGSHGLDAESCTITNCTVNNNGSCGLNASFSTITDCTAGNNNSHGIHASGKCRLENCILRENGGYGLYLDPEYSYAIKNGFGDNILGSFYLDGSHYLPTSGDEANYEF